MLSDLSIQTLLKQAANKLNAISDSAVLDAELLLAFCIDKNRTFLHTWPETELDEAQIKLFHSLIEKRLTDYPVAYILGKKSFWTLELKVTPDVLIPRPETELLVEITLDKIKDIKNPKILDLGTGSGAIALAIASERPDARILATDYSLAALKIAKYNAKQLKLNEKINFIQSSWFDSLTLPKESLNLIVSNPPYIDPEDHHLNETIRYEPQKALIANNQGMADIEEIILKCHPFIKKGGWLILEHGFDQAEKTLQLLSSNHFKRPKNYHDFNNNWRVTIGHKN